MNFVCIVPLTKDGTNYPPNTITDKRCNFSSTNTKVLLKIKGNMYLKKNYSKCFIWFPVYFQMIAKNKNWDWGKVFLSFGQRREKKKSKTNCYCYSHSWVTVLYFIFCLFFFFYYYLLAFNTHFVFVFFFLLKI